MEKDALIQELRSTQRFFNKSTRCLKEEDSSYSPAEGMMTVAQQVAHAAHSVDWFIEGAFRPEGFDLDFEDHARLIQAVESLQAAREWLDSAFDRAIEVTAAKSPADLEAPLPDGPVLGGEPRLAVYGGITDHTAHHRGALTVYARLRGRTPEMPYDG